MNMRITVTVNSITKRRVRWCWNFVWMKCHAIITCWLEIAYQVTVCLNGKLRDLTLVLVQFLPNNVSIYPIFQLIWWNSTLIQPLLVIHCVVDNYSCHCWHLCGKSQTTISIRNLYCFIWKKYCIISIIDCSSLQ